MCRADDFPPYPDATPAGQVRDALEREHADAPYPEAKATEYNGWTNRATWSAYNWLSSDEMLFRLARGRVREIQLDPRYVEPDDGSVREYAEISAIGSEARHLLETFGGPLAKRELESAGGLDAVSWSEIGDALVELFDGDDRT